MDNLFMKTKQVVLLNNKENNGIVLTAGSALQGDAHSTPRHAPETKRYT
jgi:hypothetical protein